MRIQFCIAFILVVTACSAEGDFPVAEGHCENRKPSEFVSPDGLYKAVQFSRRCGADLPSLNISVMRAGESLADEPGNVLIDVPPGDPSGYKTHIKMIWSGEHDLTIEHNSSMKVENAASSAGGLNVLHRTVPDDAA
jgi:hypothetical protein